MSFVKESNVIDYLNQLQDQVSQPSMDTKFEGTCPALMELMRGMLEFNPDTRKTA